MTAVAAQTKSAAVALSHEENNVLQAIAAYSEQIAGLAPRGMTSDYYTASLMLHVRKNPDLLKCSLDSLAQGILRTAQTGLELGVSCDLLPFLGRNPTCQFNPRYNGIIDLAYMSGIKSFVAKVVRQGDSFEYEYGTESFLRHRPIAGSKAPITHAYAIAVVRLGSPPVFEVLSREEIDATRLKHSKSWKKSVTWEGNKKIERDVSLDEIPWYAKKTAVRRLAPYLPTNPRLAAALRFAEEVEAPASAAAEEIEAVEFEVQSETSEAPTAPEAAAPAEEAELTLDQAKQTPLIGQPTSWGGKGGQPLDTLSNKALEAVRKWCATQLEKGDATNETSLQLMVDATTLILLDREKNQTSMDLADAKPKPAVTDPFPGSLEETEEARAATVAANEARAGDVGL